MVYLDIISGFLGSGKTTFANTLLDFYIKVGEKPVYIVNEYGEAGLDAEIMRTEGFRAVELTNGCICCTLKGEMVRAIGEIIEQFSPTRIVFEPSGIFMFDSFFDILEKKGLQGKCAIGNIVTVIDGVNYRPARLVFGNFIYNQIQSAPVLFLSKMDKLGEDADLTELLCDVKNINPNAVIVNQKYDELTTELLSALFLKKSDLYGHGEACGCAACNEEHDEAGCGCHGHHGHEHGQHDGCHGHHGHEHGHSHEHGECCSHGLECGHESHQKENTIHEEFETVTVEIKRNFDAEGLNAFVQDIRKGVYGAVVRAKGIVFLEGKAQLLNLTFDEMEYRFYPCFETPAMTFIGKKLMRDKIRGLA